MHSDAVTATLYPHSEHFARATVEHQMSSNAQLGARRGSGCNCAQSLRTRSQPPLTCSFSISSSRPSGTASSGWCCCSHVTDSADVAFIVHPAPAPPPVPTPAPAPASAPGGGGALSVTRSGEAQASCLNGATTPPPSALRSHRGTGLQRSRRHASLKTTVRTVGVSRLTVCARWPGGRHCALGPFEPTAYRCTQLPNWCQVA